MRCPCRNCLLIPICRERTKQLLVSYTIRHCDLCKKYIKSKSRFKKEGNRSKIEIIKYFLLHKKPPKKKRKKY
jgi:hypothetical protein